MELQRAKGMNDFPPQDMMLRNNIMNTIKKVFESYGYAPLETPIIERMDVLSAKFAAGETSDVAKEIFKLQDQGKRDLGLRFDLTVPFARFIGMNKNLKMPFKRYQIGRVFRDGPIKLGRTREFWQCDVDIAGCKTMAGDVECISVALDVFDSLGMEIEFFVNNRKILTGVMEFVGIAEKDQSKVLIVLDKLVKIGENEVKKELRGFIDKELVQKLLKLVQIGGTNQNILKKLRNTIGDNEGITELEQVFSSISDDRVKVKITLARGLNYYTGTVFEAFVQGNEMTSSVCGGGRYDNLIGGYLKSESEYPALGISFGIEPIFTYLQTQKSEHVNTPAQLYVIPIKVDALQICKELRMSGINVSMDLLGRGISKNLQYADALGIPYCVIIGETEINAAKVKLKNMKTGEEELISVSAVSEKIL